MPLVPVGVRLGEPRSSVGGIILTHHPFLCYSRPMITAIAAGVSAVVAALGLVGAINEPRAYGLAILILDIGILVDYAS